MQSHCSRPYGVGGTRQSNAFLALLPKRSGKARCVFRTEQALYGKDFTSIHAIAAPQLLMSVANVKELLPILPKAATSAAKLVYVNPGHHECRCFYCRVTPRS